MKKIDIIEVRDAAELMRMVFAGREPDAMREIKIIVSPQAKAVYDEAVHKYASEIGINNPLINPPVLTMAKTPTTIIFPSGIKVTVTDVQELNTIASP